MIPWLASTLVVLAIAIRVGGALERRIDGRGARFAGFVALVLLAVPAIAYAGYYLHLVREPIALYRIRAIAGTELAAGLCGGVTGWLIAVVRGRSPSVRTRLAGWLIAGVASLLVLVPYLKPLYGPLDRRALQDRWWNGVCMQSTLATCGPSCAATLLRDSGRPGDEASLAAEAHTSASGTECWYLARALRARGLAVALRAQDPALPCPTPAIAGVRIRFDGSGHFIALLGRDADGQYRIGDPYAGPRRLSEARLRADYDLTGFFLVVGEGAGAPAATR